MNENKHVGAACSATPEAHSPIYATKRQCSTLDPDTRCEPAKCSKQDTADNVALNMEPDVSEGCSPGKIIGPPQDPVTTDNWCNNALVDYNPFLDIIPSFICPTDHPYVYWIAKERIIALAFGLPLTTDGDSKLVDIVKLKISLSSLEPALMLNQPIVKSRATVNATTVPSTSSQAKRPTPQFNIHANHRSYSFFNCTNKSNIARKTQGSCKKPPVTPAYQPPEKLMLEVSTFYRLVNVDNPLVNTLSIWEPSWKFIIRELLDRCAGRQLLITVCGGSHQKDGERKRKRLQQFFTSLLTSTSGDIGAVNKKKTTCWISGPAVTSASKKKNISNEPEDNAMDFGTAT